MVASEPLNRLLNRVVAAVDVSDKLLHNGVAEGLCHCAILQ